MNQCRFEEILARYRATANKGFPGPRVKVRSERGKQYKLNRISWQPKLPGSKDAADIAAAKLVCGCEKCSK